MTDVAARVAAERERIHAQVRDSRRQQGLPEHVTDADVLDRLAGRLLAEVALQHDDGPGTRVRGRRDHPAAATGRVDPNATP